MVRGRGDLGRVDSPILANTMARQLRGCAARQDSCRAEEACSSAQDVIHGLQLAFPQRQRFPAESSQMIQVPLVPGDVGIQLGVPIAGIGRGAALAHGAVVAVPETAVDKDDLAPGTEDKVRGSWKLSTAQSDPGMVRAQLDNLPRGQEAVHTITVSGGMQHPAQRQFRASVPAGNARHEARTLRRRHDVHSPLCAWCMAMKTFAKVGKFLP